MTAATLLSMMQKDIAEQNPADLPKHVPYLTKHRMRADLPRGVHYTLSSHYSTPVLKSLLLLSQSRSQSDCSQYKLGTGPFHSQWQQQSESIPSVGKDKPLFTVSNLLPQDHTFCLQIMHESSVAQAFPLLLI